MSTVTAPSRVSAGDVWTLRKFLHTDASQKLCYEKWPESTDTSALTLHILVPFQTSPSFVINQIQWNLSRDLTNAHVRTRNRLTLHMHELLARHGFSSYKTQYNETTKIAALYYIPYLQTSWPHHVSWRSNSLPGMRLEVHLPVGLQGGRGPKKFTA